MSPLGLTVRVILTVAILLFFAAPILFGEETYIKIVGVLCGLVALWGIGWFLWVLWSQ